MPDLKEWLASMPVQQVDTRIEDLERELAFLRMVREMHRPVNGETQNGRSATNRNGHDHTTNGKAPQAERIVVQRPLTDERVEIVRVMLQHSQRAGTPSTVADALKRDMRPIGTTMARMARAGQLDRVRQGVYRVPEDVAAQVAKTPAPERIQGLGVMNP